MSRDTALRLLSVAVLAAAFVAAWATLPPAASSTVTAAVDPPLARQLYRKFCGQCHALKEARAVGFGSTKTKGLGPHGGPSFNQLRVPYVMSVRHVTQPTGGHEVLSRKISSKQLHTVAAYVARVTKENPIPALPTDG